MNPPHGSPLGRVLNAGTAPAMASAIDRFLNLLMALSAAAFTAVTLAYIARYDIGLSRQEIRTFALVAANITIAFVLIEYFGKKLRKRD
jgi:hypothetical protein